MARPTSPSSKLFSAPLVLRPLSFREWLSRHGGLNSLFDFPVMMYLLLVCRCILLIIHS